MTEKIVKQIPRRSTEPTILHLHIFYIGSLLCFDLEANFNESKRIQTTKIRLVNLYKNICNK